MAMIKEKIKVCKGDNCKIDDSITIWIKLSCWIFPTTFSMASAMGERNVKINQNTKRMEMWGKVGVALCGYFIILSSLT